MQQCVPEQTKENKMPVLNRKGTSGKKPDVKKRILNTIAVDSRRV